MTNKQIEELNKKHRNGKDYKPASKEVLIECIAKYLNKLPLEQVEKIYNEVSYKWINSFDTQVLRDEISKMEFEAV